MLLVMPDAGRQTSRHPPISPGSRRAFEKLWLSVPCVLSRCLAVVCLKGIYRALCAGPAAGAAE